MCQADWPDTGDFELFTRWFTADPVAAVADTGHGSVAEETAPAG